MASSQMHSSNLMRRLFRSSLSSWMQLTRTPAATRKRYLVSSPLHSAAYQKATIDLQGSLNTDSNYWWQTTGCLLAALLHDAGYSANSQEHNLHFFGRAVAPYLGPAWNARVPSPPWRSYMTDDHHPIELSWDWHTGHLPPTVRFSFEPVGVRAGTPLDPNNAHADALFRRALDRTLPAVRMDPFRHFDRELHPGTMENQSSKIFYAFDLGAESITRKAYFFPTFKAQKTGQTNLQVIEDAILRAPQITPSQLKALQSFLAFAQDPCTPPLEIDMLAIDIGPPTASRLKVYFRSRSTSFSSIQQIMTLGQRIDQPKMSRGFQNIRRLWNALLDQDGVSPQQSLPTVDHRTAGLLYNIELRPECPQPLLKLYIPVRHYASCDDHISSAVHAYIATQARTREPSKLAHVYINTMRCFL
ncbi:aromatic prenyltransferase [Aspergillus stella-maris]|uniref:aromatic prenyltransferase n=1 Tax=Aspergillus stella-maris TaxID=1810926 RepID=UPI003CCDD9BE